MFPSASSQCSAFTATWSRGLNKTRRRYSCSDLDDEPKIKKSKNLKFEELLAYVAPCAPTDETPVKLRVVLEYDRMSEPCTPPTPPNSRELSRSCCSASAAQPRLKIIKKSFSRILQQESLNTASKMTTVEKINARSLLATPKQKKKIYSKITFVDGSSAPPPTPNLHKIHRDNRRKNGFRTARRDNFFDVLNQEIISSNSYSYSSSGSYMYSDDNPSNVVFGEQNEDENDDPAVHDLSIELDHLRIE